MDGLFVLLLGPSGVGKGTTLSLLKARHREFFFPLSCTTRPMRPGEEQGETYFFVSEQEFMRKKEEGAFLEWAHVHGIQYSGILRAPVEEALSYGRNVVREVNYEGYDSIMQTSLADRVVSIFITVPNIEMLYERIKRRSDLPEEEVRHRLASAEQEIAQAGRYDYQVMSVEGDPEAVYREVERIILNHQL